jgi:hypothetical protein
MPAGHGLAQKQNIRQGRLSCRIAACVAILPQSLSENDPNDPVHDIDTPGFTNVLQCVTKGSKACSGRMGAMQGAVFSFRGRPPI